MPFDFAEPDYMAIFRKRVERLNRIRADPSVLPALKRYYKDHPAQFINDWGVTFDPRNVERGLPAAIPFILFPKQEEWVNWLVERWKNKQPGVTEKTRDMGMSWLSVSVACTLCLHYDGMTIGFGSRKEDYVDKSDSPKSLFYKARMFMANLPIEFRGGYNPKTDAPHLRIKFPESGAFISGEAGDNIGRGDRTSIYFVDESAHIEHPEMLEASLSATTNCRQDISTPLGMNNSFARRRFNGKIPVFTFHWRDDPRKNDAWYAKMVEELDNPVVIAQELDIDYAASVEGVLIPSAWVQAAVDAHIKLKVEPSGDKLGALDVADEGKDTNAFCGAHGICIQHLEEWSGKGDDIFGTVQRAFRLCDELGYKSFKYDADGLGAGVRGDARIVNDQRPDSKLVVEAFRGSAAVLFPEREDVKGRKNQDFFANLKAQAWWSLRTRFQKTFRAVTEGKEFDPDDIISIPSTLKLRAKLVSELSQPTFKVNNVGKIVVEKTPDGGRSPNLADSVMIRFGNAKVPIRIHPGVLLRA